MLLNLIELHKKYSLKVSGVIHIGAHFGEEYKVYEDLNLNNLIFFEPLPKNFEVLYNKLHDKANCILVNKALGNEDKKIEMYVESANQGQSSSMLKPKIHLTQYPHIQFNERCEVDMVRLDDYQFDKQKYNFINIDVQGFELEVFKGASKILKNIDYIMTEVNRAEVYESNATVDQLDKFLGEYGFERVETDWAGNTWGDAFYIKQPKLKVIVTTYNNENWAETNIESILEQTYKNFEVLYIDDASSDSTYDIAKKTINSDNRFKLIRHDSNMSKAYCFMTYIKEFVDDNDIILFIDGDDWIPYNNIFQHVSDFYTNHNCWVAYTKLICYPSLSVSSTHGSKYSDNIHKFNLYRKTDFISSHLKTMRGFIYKNINEDDLKFNGNWTRFGDDVAIMCAAMEQSPKEKIGVMDFVGYAYNESDENRKRTDYDYKLGRIGEDYIRSIKPYDTIVDKFDKYISPRMLGRLANQMFEIATAYSLSIDNKCSMKVSIENGVYASLTGEVGSPLNYKDTVFKNVEFIDSVSNYDVWKEPKFSYIPISYKFDKNLYLDGQFQSEKYFEHNKDKILELFKCDDISKDYIISKYGSYLKKPNVSIHIRRGDYLSAKEYHPACDLNYYEKALGYFPNISYIIVFGDDIQWAKENFIGDKFIFVENEKDYIDLYLMSMCENNIIANSSFSWWGSWLNTNTNKKVIAPKNWFGNSLKHHNTCDLFPNDWILL